MLNYDDLYDKELFRLWERRTLDKVSENADEPICGLLWVELDYLLDNIRFSSNRNFDRFQKFLIRLHCLGIKDTKISEGLLKLTHFEMSPNLILKRRQKCMERLNEYYGKDIGLITLLGETFRNSDCFEDIEYDSVINAKIKREIKRKNKKNK